MRTLKKSHLAVIGVVTAFVVSGTSFSHWPPMRNLAKADSAKVVSVSDCGIQKIITTDAPNVGEVLTRAGVTLAEGDLVEPSAATPISGGFFNINVYCSKAYRIVDGEKVTTVMSAQQAPKLIAADAHITLYPEDTAVFGPVSDFVEGKVVGENILITRAKELYVIADGSQTHLRSQKSTVGEVLAEKGFKLGEKDTITPNVSSAVAQGMQVRITRVSVVVTTKEETIDRNVQTIYDNTILRGTTKVKTEGADGKKNVTYQLTYHNGEVVGRKILASDTVLQPQTRVEIVGTKVYYPNEVVALAGSLAAERGWVNDQWDALYQLWNHESHFNPGATNLSSGACGIPQAYPCSKLPGYPNDPAAQIRWGLNYISSKYGNPVNAWNYWQSHKSY